MEFLESSTVISPNDAEVDSFPSLSSKQATSVSPTKKEDSNKLPMTQPISSSKTGTLESSEFECSLCFRLFCRPVTTSCGHTYCKSCLLAALKYSVMCPLCRCKLDPASKHKYSVNIVILNILEKYFKEEHEAREREEEEEEEQDDKIQSEKETVDFDDYYTRWSNCLIPSVRETCSVLLSCT